MRCVFHVHSLWTLRCSSLSQKFPLLDISIKWSNSGLDRTYHRTCGWCCGVWLLDVGLLLWHFWHLAAVERRLSTDQLVETPAPFALNLFDTSHQRLTLSHVISWRMICVKVHQFVADEAYAFGCWQLKTLILWTSYVEQRHAGQCRPWVGQRKTWMFSVTKREIVFFFLFFFGRVFWDKKKSKASFCGPLCDGGLRHYHYRRCLNSACDILWPLPCWRIPVLGTPCCHQLRKPTDTWARPISVL